MFSILSIVHCHILFLEGVADIDLGKEQNTVILNILYVFRSLGLNNRARPV